MIRALSAILFALALALPAQEARYRDGIERYNRGRFAEALEDFRAAVRMDPDGPFAVPSLWKIAELLLDRGDEEGYVRALTAIHARDRGAVGRRAALTLARFLAGRGLSAEAVRVYGALLALPGEEGRVEALAHLRRSGDAAPLTPSPEPLSGDELARLGRLLARRAELDAPHASADAAMHGEIQDLLERGDPAAHAAMKRFLELYDRSPFSSPVRYELGRLEEAAGQLGTALNLYRTSKRGAEPALARAADRRIGILLCRLDRPAEALPHLEASGEPLAAALAALAAKEHARAARHLQDALRAAGHPVPASREELAARMPRLALRTRLVDALGARTVDRPVARLLDEAHDALGSGDAAAAQSAYARALERAPAHDGARLGLALARLQAGLPREARDALEPLLARHPADPDLLELSFLAAHLARRPETAARALLALCARRTPDLRARLDRLAAEGFSPVAGIPLKEPRR